MPNELRVGSQFDVGPILAGVNQSVDAIEAGTARMNMRFNRLGAESEAALNKTVFSSTEARHAIHGLGEEIGVHMPRFVQTFVAHLGGVGPLMAAAFTPIAVVGLLEVLEHVPEVIQKGIDKLMGFDEEMKKTLENARTENIRLQIEQIALHGATAVEIHDGRYEGHFDAGIAAIHDGVAVQAAALG